MQLTVNPRWLIASVLIAVGLFFFARSHHTEAKAAEATLDYQQAQCDAAAMLAYCAFIQEEAAPQPAPTPKPDGQPVVPAKPLKPSKLTMPTLAPPDGTTFTMPILASVMQCEGGQCTTAPKQPATARRFLAPSPLPRTAVAGLISHKPVRRTVGFIGRLFVKLRPRARCG